MSSTQAELIVAEQTKLFRDALIEKFPDYTIKLGPIGVRTKEDSVHEVHIRLEFNGKRSK